MQRTTFHSALVAALAIATAGLAAAQSTSG